MPIKYGILLALLILGIVLLVYFYPCLLLDFSPLPQKMADHSSRKVILLYGYGICGDCAAGQFLLTLKDKNPSDFLIIVPEEFSAADIMNMRDVFMLTCEIINGDKDIEKLIKRIASCKKIKTWEKNYLIELSNDREISTIKLL